MGCSAGDEHKRGGICVLERIERAARVHARKDERSGGATLRLGGSIDWQAARNRPYKKNGLKYARRRWAVSSRRSRAECTDAAAAAAAGKKTESQTHRAVVH